MDKIAQLDKLFEEWEKHLINKKAPYAGSLFRPDGFIGDNSKDYDKILIIAKESNNSNDYDKLEESGIGPCDEKKSDPYFWFKEVVGGEPDCNRSKLVKRCAMLHEAVDYRMKNHFSEIPDDVCQEIIIASNNYQNILKNSAYMNYKKVGGRKKCRDYQLVKWSKKYETQMYLKDEIGIISPNAIVICGTEVLLNDLKELIKLAENEYKFIAEIFWAYHPSKPGLSYKELIKTMEYVKR